MKKNKFIEHIPSFGRDYEAESKGESQPIEIYFNDQDELFNHDYFKFVKEISNFEGFSLGNHYLMYTQNNGFWWWVVGYIARPDLLTLPAWKAKFCCGTCNQEIEHVHGCPICGFKCCHDCFPPYGYECIQCFKKKCIKENKIRSYEKEYLHTAIKERFCRKCNVAWHVESWEGWTQIGAGNGTMLGILCPHCKF